MMNQSRTGWDVAKIQEWIDPQDVETILNITLCSTAHQDLIGWHYTRHGFYTVKSGYWLATHAQEGEQVLPPPGNVELKQAHWKIKTAPKIKHFFWCLLSNALPTGATLKYRHITNDSTCVRCCRMQRNGKTQKIIFRSLQRFPQQLRHNMSAMITGLKCNYDATYIKDLPSTAGWIMRDDRGTYLGAGQAIGSITNSSLESEFQALVMAMQHCWSKGYTKLHFEGDNKEITDIINGGSSHFDAFNWIGEVGAWKTRFVEYQFTWIGRNSNMAADTLAKQPIPLNSSFYFHNLIPHVTTDILHRDFVSANL